MRITAALAALLAGVALVGAACGGDDEAGDTDTTATDTTEPIQAEVALKGSVGPGFEISLSTEDGAAVTTLEAGSYELEIEDLASDHNFHLTGTAVDISTDVAEEGTQNVTVDFQAGTYTFLCDPHATSMTGSFQVT